MSLAVSIPCIPVEASRGEERLGRLWISESVESYLAMRCYTEKIDIKPYILHLLC